MTSSGLPIDQVYWKSTGKNGIVITSQSHKMQQIRKQIDGIDKKIIQLLSKRMKLAIKLGKLKKKRGMPVLDKKRELEMLKKLEKQAGQLGLDPKSINKLYKEIFKKSRNAQR